MWYRFCVAARKQDAPDTGLFDAGGYKGMKITQLSMKQSCIVDVVVLEWNQE
jgi:hypothetical protein